MRNQIGSKALQGFASCARGGDPSRANRRRLIPRPRVRGAGLSVLKAEVSNHKGTCG